MKVKANIARMDALKFSIEILPSQRQTYYVMLFFTALVTGLVFKALNFPATIPEWILMSSISLFGGVFASFLSFIVANGLHILQTGFYGVNLGEHVYEMSEDGFELETHVYRAIYYWSGIRDVRSTISFLLIKINQNNFLIVPKRSFDSEERFFDFSAKADELWSTHKLERPG